MSEKNDRMNEKRLKKCPFCGGEARLEQVPSATWDKFVVTCKSPKCCAFYIGYCDEGLYDTRTKAIESWNTRVPMQKIVERLEKDSKHWWKMKQEALKFNEGDLVNRYDAFEIASNNAIDIVKEEGGLNDL